MNNMKSFTFGDLWTAPGLAHVGVVGAEGDHWIWVSPDEDGEVNPYPIELHAATQARQLAEVFTRAADNPTRARELADILIKAAEALDEINPPTEGES
jgi:hypothetical protein